MMKHLVVSLCIVGNLASGFSSQFHPCIPTKMLSSQFNEFKNDAAVSPVILNFFSSSSSHITTKNQWEPIRGGGNVAVTSEDSAEGSKFQMRKVYKFASSFWATGGVLMILLNSIRRIVPIALEPFKTAADITPLNSFQLG